MPQQRRVVSLVLASGGRKDIPAARTATGISGPRNSFALLTPTDEDEDGDHDEHAAAAGPDGAAQGAAGGAGGADQGAAVGAGGAAQGAAEEESALAA